MSRMLFIPFSIERNYQNIGKKQLLKKVDCEKQRMRIYAQPYTCKYQRVRIPK